MTKYMRYRDFIADLEADAAEDDMMRVIENRYLAETCDTWLSLAPGRDGGVALIRSRKLGKAPTDAGVTIRISPTVMMTALAPALARSEMMELARLILKPGEVVLNVRHVRRRIEGLADESLTPSGMTSSRGWRWAFAGASIQTTRSRSFSADTHHGPIREIDR